jgi:hypothetical protein
MKVLSVLLTLLVTYLGRVLAESDDRYTATYLNVTNSPLFGRNIDQFFGWSVAAFGNYFAGNF